MKIYIYWSLNGGLSHQRNIHSSLAVRKFLVAQKVFLNAKFSLSLSSKWQIGHRKWFLNTNKFFLEHWNSQKSLCNIQHRFLYLLDEWIEKICIFSFSWWLFFKSTFCDIKNVVECYKDFFGYFNVLETHSDIGWQNILALANGYFF